ncbi:MAG TPA: PEGA domain-containing protein, partial [Blastocatellia bacterium]|nr:PEGA domain-containing protein [Blastocatellia bacterium]
MNRRQCHPPYAPYGLLLFLLCIGLSVSVAAQDPSGRPSRGRHTHSTAKPKAPEPVTVTLTILTHPPQCEVFINGEDRGATNDEGKIVINKLPLGLYTIEARKDGFDTANSRFDAGPQEPTLVLNLKVSIEDRLKLFQSLVSSGKLDG